MVIPTYLNNDWLKPRITLPLAQAVTSFDLRAVVKTRWFHYQIDDWFIMTAMDDDPIMQRPVTVESNVVTKGWVSLHIGSYSTVGWLASDT